MAIAAVSDRICFAEIKEHKIRRILIDIVNISICDPEICRAVSVHVSGEVKNVSEFVRASEITQFFPVVEDSV